MRRILTKSPLFLFLSLALVPIASIIYLSFSNLNGDAFRWYNEILGEQNFTNSLGLSVSVSLIVGGISAIFAFFISLTWFDDRQFLVGFMAILILGLMPPDVIALSISKLSQIVGMHRMNILFLTFALSLYCIPFCILLLWSRMYFFDKSLLTAARDLGMTRWNITIKVIFPIVLPAIAACFLLSFLLALNEYPRTYYLSGAHQFVSEYLNGKLSAGTDESIYAGGSITVVMTIILIAGGLFIGWLRKNRRLFGTPKP